MHNCVVSGERPFCSSIIKKVGVECSVGALASIFFVVSNEPPFCSSSIKKVVVECSGAVLTSPIALHFKSFRSAVLP